MRSWHLKIFSMKTSGGHLICMSRTTVAILVGRPLDNIPVKFESHSPKGSGVGF